MLVRLLAAALLATLIIGSAGARGEPQASAATPCPAGALPLTKEAIVRSIAAAIRAEEKASDAMVTSATLAIYDRSPRGAQILRSCGVRAMQRSVIVYFSRRAYLPAQSASSGISFVARFRGGYRVWFRAH